MWTIFGVGLFWSQGGVSRILITFLMFLTGMVMMRELCFVILKHRGHEAGGITSDIIDGLDFSNFDLMIVF